MPSPYQSIFDTDGVPVPNALITVYEAGTTTKINTFTDVTLTVANTNPIVADAAGRFVAFLTPGLSYKFEYTDADGATVAATRDNIFAVPSSSKDLDVAATAGTTISAGQVVYLSDGSGGLTAGRWYPADADLTYGSLLPIIGMATASIVSGADGTVRLAGRITGLSGLTSGTIYYISATAGALTSVIPTLARMVGVADSSTSLIMFPDERLVRAGYIGIASQVALDFIYASSAYKLARLAAGSALQYPRINTAGTAWEFATLSSPVVPYAVTLTNVTDITPVNILSWTVPANAMADQHEIIVPCILALKNNSGSARTPVFKLVWGATSITLSNLCGAGWIASANEYIQMTEFRMMRVGATLYLKHHDGSNTTFDPQNVNQFMETALTRSPASSGTANTLSGTPDFTLSSTVAIEVTLDNNNAAYYVHPLWAQARRYLPS